MKYIIIGGVAGGATAAARLRRIDETSEILLIERGNQVSFGNAGLPYYLGGVVSSKEALEIKSIDALATRYNLDIRVNTELKSIDSKKKEIVIKNLNTNIEKTESYDKLVITAGDYPELPNIKGSEKLNNFFTLRSIEDFDNLKNFLNLNKPKTATVIGGGILGLQMAENLTNLGLKVTIVEKNDQILPNLDYEMTQFIFHHLEDNNVDVVYGNEVLEVKENSILLSNKSIIESDVTIYTLGHKPTNNLSAKQGIELSKNGSIQVNEFLETNLNDIYAIGDIIETNSSFNDYHELFPLSGPALRQARIVADNLLGAEEKYIQSQSTSVVKVFDYIAGSTGYNEKYLKENHLEYDAIHIHPGSFEGYYPGSSNVSMKVLYNPKTEEILGVQATGMNGVDKRIDVLATAMKAKMKVTDLKDLELTYAVPYSSGKDPINVAGYVAHNKINGLVKTVNYDEINDLVQLGEYILDIRDELEFEMGSIPTAINIPLPVLRERLSELPKNRKIHVFCQVGMRGYVAARILEANGFDVYNIDGGFKTYSCVYDTSEDRICDDTDVTGKIKMEHLKGEIKMSEGKVVLNVDAAGLQCPGPIVKLYKSLEDINHGEVLEIKATDPGFKTDVKKWAQKTGNQVLDIKTENGVITAKIQKGALASQPRDNKVIEDKNGTTIVVFSQDLDKALAAFIIAQGAATMGKKVNLFFTFWGLNVLRQAKKVKVRKTFMEKMFGWMMPRGPKKLPISNMNMMGMGSSMIKSIMKKKNVDSLPVMIENAKDLGVNIQACAMSMDIMGIKKEELIEGIEVVGVATYLADTTEANHNLFI